ncbi:MAG: hypothetical protein KKE17_06950 [Proteobacteria bacterium]|nr:hypothetical protein [Pseudomonadota bacterium]MBU1709725.1 hypothetical protein [Pseudomonadota bacterium]
MKHGFYRRIFPFLLLLLVLPACGRKTLPVPPQSVLPVPVNDLRYQLDEKGVTLFWSRPTSSETGGKLAAVDHYEILKAAVRDEDHCPGCPVVYEKFARVESELDGRGNQKKSAQFFDSGLQPGHRYHYKVRTSSGWRLESRDSNIISFVWTTPAGAPENLLVTAGDSHLLLSWSPPAKALDGTEINSPLSYAVYRGNNEENFKFLGSTESTTYTDASVENSRKYFYRIRAQSTANDTKAAGAASAIAWGVPKDQTPPAPPLAITVVKWENSNRIFWEAVTDKDLAGYRIYRRDASSPVPKLIGNIPSNAIMFTDNTLPKGPAKLYYSVTAFDRASPANESVFSNEAEIILHE